MKVLLKDDNKTDSYEQEADHLRARTENLRAEAEVLQALCTDEPGDVALHPGIPAYIECVCDGKGEFAGFVMEYVEGRSLQKILDDGRSFTVREAAVAGLQFCGIMEQLHGQDPPMIFRDLKPANILVRPDGKFVLVDYGAVRKLRKSAGSDTMRLGTDGYAAPEQYGGWEQSDERTDIYGIGAVLHHMVTGRPPLDTGLRPLGEILGAQGETLQYDGLAQILMRCCMTAPSMRYCSCKELEKALQGVLRNCERSGTAGSRYLKRVTHGSSDRGWKRFVLLVNTAVVCLALALVLAATAAGAKTVEYCAFVEEAGKKTALEEKKEAYLKAVALRPEEPEAKKALDDVLFARVSTGQLWEKAAGGAEGNLERMRKKRPGYYAALQMELGKVYFACYEGGREAAKQCFRNALSEGGIWFGDREMAEAMEVVFGEEWTGERIGAWRVLEETAEREAEMSGNGVFAAAVCKAAAVEIALFADRYEEAGADPEKLKEVVQIAGSFVDEAESGRIRVPDRLLEELRTAVDSAARIVNSSVR